MSIHFGPAGNSESFAAAGFRASADAPAWLAKMGLNAYEYQCGHGVSVGAGTAQKIGEAARANGITLSLHTPYYINLSSGEAERREKNVGYLLQSCEAASAMGAQRLVVHCGGVGKQSAECNTDYEAFGGAVELSAVFPGGERSQPDRGGRKTFFPCGNRLPAFA